MGVKSFKIKDMSLMRIKKNKKRDYKKKILDNGHIKINGYWLSIPEIKTESLNWGTGHGWGMGHHTKNRCESLGTCRILRPIALLPAACQNIFSDFFCLFVYHPGRTLGDSSLGNKKSPKEKT